MFHNQINRFTFMMRFVHIIEAQEEDLRWRMWGTKTSGLGGQGQRWPESGIAAPIRDCRALAVTKSQHHKNVKNLFFFPDYKITHTTQIIVFPQFNFLVYFFSLDTQYQFFSLILSKYQCWIKLIYKSSVEEETMNSATSGWVRRRGGYVGQGCLCSE